MNKKGSVILHVLVTSVVMGMLAAGMMGVVMMQYRLVHREMYGSKGKKYDEMALSLVVTYWNFRNTSCERIPPIGWPPLPGGLVYTCGGGPVGGCVCTCSAGDPYSDIVVTSVGGACKIVIQSKTSYVY